MTIDMAQFHQAFFEESFEGLDSMESGLLGLEPGTVAADEINAIFRAAHSIKGGSGTFGFTEVAGFTHSMETLLDEMRDARRAVTVEAVGILLQAVDVLRDMLTAARDGGAVDPHRVTAQCAELERLLAGALVAPASVAPSVAEGAAESVDETFGAVEPIGWKVAFRPHPHLPHTGNDALRILRELARLGPTHTDCDLSALPVWDDLEPEDLFLSWNMVIDADIAKEQIDEIFAWVEDDCDYSVVPMSPVDGDRDSAIAHASGASPNQLPGDVEIAPGNALVPVDRRRKDRRIAQDSERRGDTERRKGAASAAVSGGGSIRVDTHKIDALINMVGELVITQSMLGMLGETFDPSQIARLREGLAQLERHTRELQEGVMQIRMLPISFAFNRFPRLVHDLSNKLGKKVQLVMTGEDTEVDKTVIEKIGDPLVHLVRNSLDHGIETPAERLTAGKAETGTIHLRASHQGGNIVIEIRDDGRGLDRARILSKAIARGLVRDDDNRADVDIYELIFVPGFSTVDQVSDVSGRGVGMDVVRRNVNELGGSIAIESEPGRGSAIVVRLPLTMAILDGQSIRVGRETYIVPLVSIVESIQVRRNMLNLVAGRGETVKLRDEHLPIVRLHQLFTVDDPDFTELTAGIVVVVEGEGRKCGLFVDELLGQQQVVVKSLEVNYQRVEGIAGATILGDGTVALIIDIPGLMRLAKQDRGISPDLSVLARSA